MQRLSSLWRRSPLVQSRWTHRPFRQLLSGPNCRDKFPFRAAHTATQLSPSPTTITMGPEAFGNFDLVKRVKLDFTDVVVSKWRSNVTGLTVIHLDYEGACDQIQCSVDKRLKACKQLRSSMGISLWQQKVSSHSDIHILD